MEKRNILIVSYYFPPNKSVGARRWAKFSKYLQRKGHNVVVICAENPTNSNSPWDKDIEGMNIHTLPVKYPAILFSNPSSLLNKIKYKLSVKYLQLTTKGTIYDQTLFWEKQLLTKAHELIKENNIDTVITNGPPFRLLYYCTKLKQSFPNIKLISDFRDPWTWWYNMGYPQLKGKDKAIEFKMEEEVINLSDLVLTPNDVMQKILIEKYPSRQPFIKELPHAYDGDEFFAKDKQGQKKANGKLNLIYFGTLYNGLEDEYRLFSKALKSAENDVNLDIYTNQFDYQNVFHEDDLDEVVHFKRAIPMSNLSEIIANYDYVVILSPDFGKENISTKFFEIINFRIPFLFISKPGKASRFIEDNSLGIHLEAAALQAQFESIVNNTHEFVYNREFDVEPYSFDKQTDNLLQYISGLKE